MKTSYGYKYFKNRQKKHDDIYAHVIAGVVTFAICMGVIVLHALIGGK